MHVNSFKAHSLQSLLRLHIDNFNTNMYSIVGSVVTLYICFAVGMTIAADNGYIYKEMPYIPCKNQSSAISPCPSSLTYKLPDFSNHNKSGDSSIRNVQDIQASTRNYRLMRISALHSASEECKKVGTKFFCETAYPYRCKDADVVYDGKKIQATCDEARKACSSSGYDRRLRDSLLKCSSSTFAAIFGLQYRFPRKLSCFAFPVIKNDPYKCEDNYKVYAYKKEFLNDGKGIASRHRIFKRLNIPDVECEKNVADVVCKTLPACSRDETKVVYIFSKQECRQIVGCVNKTKKAILIEVAHGLCKSFPAGTTAKKYPLANVYDNKAVDNDYDNKAVGRAMAFSTILFIAVLVGSSFFY